MDGETSALVLKLRAKIRERILDANGKKKCVVFTVDGDHFTYGWHSEKQAWALVWRDYGPANPGIALVLDPWKALTPNDVQVALHEHAARRVLAE